MLVNMGKCNGCWCRLASSTSIGVLKICKITGCACAGNARNVFPATEGKRSQHASRHVRDTCAIMHAGMTNQWLPLKSMAGETFPAFPVHFTYLVRNPLYWLCRMINGSLLSMEKGFNHLHHLTVDWETMATVIFHLNLKLMSALHGCRLDCFFDRPTTNDSSVLLALRGDPSGDK